MIGDLISAGSKILGGILGNSAADRQMEMQKDFAQKGIRWRVADAKAAGIHPLYALGAQTQSYSPVATGDFGISAAGQDIGRAIDSTRTEGERGVAVNDAMMKLQLENQKLQNDSLRMDVASKVSRLAENPALPGTPMNIPGQGNSGVSLPIPGGAGSRLSVAHPNVGQEAENHYSEIGGNLFGTLAILNDTRVALDKWFADKFGAGLNRYTPTNVFAPGGIGDLRARRQPHSGAGESW